MALACIRNFGDKFWDRWSGRLNEQVDFRGIGRGVVQSLRSFLTWKFDFGAILERRDERSRRRIASAHEGRAFDKPALMSRLWEGIGIGHAISPFSIAVLQTMALIAGMVGLLMAPHGDAHAPSLFAGLWVLAAVVVIRKIGTVRRIGAWLQYGLLAVICLFPAVAALKSGIRQFTYQPYEVRMRMLGQGIAPFPSETVLEFIREQGVIAWLLIGGLLTWGVWRAAGVLGKPKMDPSLAAGEREGKASGESSMDLFCAAAVTILVILYRGLSLSNSGVMLSMASSLGVLFAISHTRKSEQRTPGRKRAKTVAWAVCAGLAVASVMGINLFSGSIARGYTPGAPTLYVAWRNAPDPIKKQVATNIPAAMTWSEGHALIRRCFGAHLDTPLSAPAYIAARITGADYSTNPLRSLGATLLGMRLSSTASTDRLNELYINLQDYGIIGGPTTWGRTIGIAQMSQRMFGVAPSALKPEQTEFLVGSPLRVDNLSLLDSARPVQFATAPSRYKYIGYETKGLPAVGGWEMHNGVLNSKGEYASYMVAQGTYPYVTSIKGATPLEGHNPATEAWSINDAGEVAGSSAEWAACWDQSGAIHNLGILPGFAYCTARAINNRDEIVGYAWNADASEGQHEFLNTAHAFLWSKGQMHDLSVPLGYVSSRAYAINNRGEAAGMDVN